MRAACEHQALSVTSAACVDENHARGLHTLKIWMIAAYVVQSGVYGQQRDGRREAGVVHDLRELVRSRLRICRVGGAQDKRVRRRLYPSVLYMMNSLNGILG